MSFAPVIPFGGYAGWAFLKRTMATQKEAFVAAPDIQRDETYFRAKIGSVSTAEALVSDHRLLKVALGAYGLDEDINARFFIQKVLEDGTLDDADLAMRLSDTRYRAFSAAFGFGDYAVPGTTLSDFADTTLAAYETRQFEAAVGAQNDTLRLALNAEREVAGLAGKSSSDDTKWYSVMGSEPLRQVFQTALSLPSSFASIDLDQQLTVLKEKTEQIFGSASVSQFSEPEKLEKLLRTYLLKSDAASGGSSRAGGANALQLLQSDARNAAANILSLL